MEDENNSAGKDGPDLPVGKFKRDYLLVWRGQTRAYYLTEIGIYEASFRSRASLVGVAQIPMVGRAINRKLSNKAASNNLTYATIKTLKEEGKITKEILWKDVQRASINGDKFSVIGNYDNLKFSFLKHWEKTDWGRLINYILATYLGDRFASTHAFPRGADEIVKKVIETWIAEGVYQPLQGTVQTEKTGLSGRTEVDAVKNQISSAEKFQEPVKEAPKKETTTEGPKKKNTGTDRPDNQDKTKKSGNNDSSPGSRFKKQIGAALVVLIVVAAALIVLHNDISGGSPVEPSASYANYTYSSDTVLSSNVFAGNVTIDQGVTVTTEGFNFFVTGSFVNHGTIETGHKYIAQNLSKSFGGSGGGGGFSYTTNSIGESGFRTSYPGGLGGFPGHSGVSSNLTSVSKSTLSLWYNSSTSSTFPDSLAQYLMGASGGLSGNFQNSGAAVPGEGAFGIVIEANYIFAGNISANGTGSTGGGAGAGGGGGGVILILYGSGGIVKGNFDVLGGGGISPGITYASNYGGNGGNGIVVQEHLTGKL